MEMKRVLSINLGNFGSTGKIMRDISDKANKYGFEAFMAYPGSVHNVDILPNDYLISSEFVKKINEKLAYYTGYNGCFAVFSTIRLICHIKKIKPDIIHFHNLHNSYVNLPILFNYIKKNNVSVVWTLHDCWSFTGQCPHFTMAMCDKWKIGCYDCPSYRDYPHSRVDRTSIMWKLKNKWFTNVENLTIVTPSQWLADLLKQSYLRDYSIKVINNGIDVNIFKPTPSDFRNEYGIADDKFILLGVAFGWGKKKGLDVFLNLYDRLDTTKYQIVLVGTDDGINRVLPSGIISIQKTNNQKELAEIYTAADLFVNPTREEVLGLVNIEAEACGTPVVTFKTGGSPECISSTCGFVVNTDDMDDLVEKIEYVYHQKPFDSKACMQQAILFDKNKKYKEYMELYKEIIN